MALRNVEMFLVWSVWWAYVQSMRFPAKVAPIVQHRRSMSFARTAPKTYRAECSEASSATTDPSHWSQPIRPIVWKMSFLVVNIPVLRSLLPGSNQRKIHTEHLLWLVGCEIQKRYFALETDNDTSMVPHLHEAIVFRGRNRCRLFVSG